MRVLSVLSWVVVLCAPLAQARAGDGAADLIKQLETFKPGKQDQRPDVQALVKLGKPAVAPLVTALKNPKAAACAAMALGQIGDKSAALPLAQCAISGAESAVGACAKAIVLLGDPAALPPLRAFLKKPKGKPVFLYDGAIMPLGYLKDREAVADLRKQAKHKSQYVRGAVALALGQIGDASAAKEVLALGKDKNDIVASFGLIAAGRLKLAEAKPALLEAFKGKDPRGAGEGLGYLGAHDVLYAALDGKGFQQVEGAVLGLAASGDDKAFEAVSKLLAKDQVNGGVAQAAADGFVRGGHKRGVGPLTKVRDQFKKKGKSYTSVVEILDGALDKLERGDTTY